MAVPHSIEFVKSQFIKAGVIPTFDRYQNARQHLTFICKCGQPGIIIWLNFYNHGNEPLCKRCAREKNRLNGINQAKYLPHPTGSDHPRWDSNLTEADRQAASYGRGAKFHRWIKDIFRLYDYTCYLTGKPGELAAHHLWNWADYPEKRYDLENGVCILQDLHIIFHAKFGRKNNTPSQFQEFKETL